jgi:hypothetical protein
MFLVCNAMFVCGFPFLKMWHAKKRRVGNGDREWGMVQKMGRGRWHEHGWNGSNFA